jgi:hypothetical protein
VSFTPARETRRTKKETAMDYHVLRIEPGASPESVEHQLNTLGRRGWDLVCTFRAPRSACECLVLKRDDDSAGGLAGRVGDEEEHHAHG